MRKPEYLSPSSITKWRNDQEAFYTRYLSDKRLPDEPQTQPMSVGSAFDAHIKSYLHEMLFGKGNDPRFELTTLFEAQVAEHNRDWAWKAGRHCFEEYLESGAATDLALDLQQAVGTPKFEIEVKGVVSGYREGISASIGGVTLLGKPDVFYINQHGQPVILDWKVNGYCSPRPTYPMQGYVRIRKHPKNCGQHRDAVLAMHGGTMINISVTLDQLNEEWARQLTIYEWLTSGSPGDDFIAGIDQLCCCPNGSAEPSVYIAEHRLRVDTKFQHDLFAEIQEIWNIIHSDHIFRELSKEESQQRCALLDAQSTAFDPNDPMDKAFLDITKSKTQYRPR